MMALRSLARTVHWGAVGRARTTAVARNSTTVRHFTNPTEFFVPSQPRRHVIAGGLTLLVYSTPFIFLGAYAAKMMASGLEDFDLFVPDDDDD